MEAPPAPWKRVELLLDRSVTPGRVQHSRRVARLARELCLRYGLDGDLGLAAGLGHDVARELDLGTIRSLADEDGRGYSEDELAMPVLLHGRAAAVLLGKEAGVTQVEVLEAVRDHVTGRPGMGLLSRIVFAADYLEPGRLFLEESRRASVVAGSLDGMVHLAVSEVIAYLEGAGRPVARAARELEAEVRAAAGRFHAKQG